MNWDHFPLIASIGGKKIQSAEIVRYGQDLFPNPVQVHAIDPSIGFPIPDAHVAQSENCLTHVHTFHVFSTSQFMGFT